MPPSAEPFEELVDQAVLARLQGWDQWRDTPALITRSLLKIDQYKRDLKDGAVLGVCRGSGDSVTPATHDEDGWRYEHEVVIVGYVEGDKNLIASTRMNRLRADARACLNADITLGGLVTSFMREGPSHTDDNTVEPQAIFQESWRAVRE